MIDGYGKQDTGKDNLYYGFLSPMRSHFHGIYILDRKIFLLI